MVCVGEPYLGEGRAGTIIFSMLLYRIALGVVLLAVSAAASAAPTGYVLDRDRSSVQFTWFYGQSAVGGRIDIADADVVLDLDRIAGSDVRVALDAGSAQAGFLFATQALRGPRMFDADSFPRITFASEGFRVSDGAVEVDGSVTIRGVTRPMVMQATLFRQPGTEPADRDHLAIELVGAIDRHEFGASAFPQEVGAAVEFRILAYIDKAL